MLLVFLDVGGGQQLQWLPIVMMGAHGRVPPVVNKLALVIPTSIHCYIAAAATHHVQAHYDISRRSNKVTQHPIKTACVIITRNADERVSTAICKACQSC